jgi:hypothetical protein
MEYRTLPELMERARELHREWLAQRGKDVQLSLLTAEEICATVDYNYRPQEGKVK